MKAVDELRLKPTTMFKSMTTTVIVILDNLIKTTVKKIDVSFIDLRKYFNDNFINSFNQVLIERQICSPEDTDTASHEVFNYVSEYLEQLCRVGMNNSYKDIISKNTSAITQTFQDKFSIEKQNMIVSNAISTVLLLYIKFALSITSREIVDDITQTTIGTMGYYSASSLEKFILDKDESDLEKLFKIIVWVFINGNPDMDIVVTRFNSFEFVIQQTGLCRQYVNSKILNMDSQITWPVNLASFIEMAHYISHDLKVDFTKKQCEGDSVCELICSINKNQG